MNGWKKLALWPIAFAAIAQSLGGCSCFQPSVSTYSVNSPPALSQPQLGPQIEPIPEPDGAVNDPTFGPEFSQPAPARRIPVPESPTEELEGPVIVPFGQAPEGRIELEVTADASRLVGEAATFRLTIRNTSGETLEELVVSSEFDEALVFPGREEKQVQQVVERLDAGQRREIALSLVSREAGRHCAYFAIRLDGDELAWKSVCVQFGPAQQEANTILPWRWSWWGR